MSIPLRAMADKGSRISSCICTYEEVSNLGLPKYVLITPARNETQFIELTIKSVVAQTVLPLKWVIASDGSTDGTDDIVSKYAVAHPWMELVRLPERRERHFAGKVLAFNAGYERVADLDYQIIGNLDGDVSFDETYFEFLLQKFADNPRLGVGGTPFREGSFRSDQYDYRFTSIEHVSGQIQIFRRECFEQIGGYVPRKIGGIDLVAVTTARMRGWETRAFLEKSYNHHRPMGTATEGGIRVSFKIGWKDYMLGSHPLWEFCRCIYQMKGRPFILNGVFRLLGYTWAMVSAEKQVSRELVRFRRNEQMRRLRAFVSHVARLRLPITAPRQTSRQG